MAGARAFGRDISVQALGGALAVAVVAIAIALWKWHRHFWNGISASWSWLGSTGAVPHWLIIALAGTALVGVTLLAVALWPVDRWPAFAPAPEPEQPRPVAEAEAFRDAFERFLDTFLDWRDQVHWKGTPVQDEWQDEYRKLRRAALDTFQPIRDPLRKWFARIDEHWTSRWPGEPVWHDIDGPDESDESIIDKFFMPLTLPDAIQFWDGFIPGKLHDIKEERIDLIDSFIRMLRRPPESEPQPRYSYRRPGRLRGVIYRLRARKVRGRNRL